MPKRKKNNPDLWLIFDVTIAEIVSSWAENNPESIDEAISRLGIFIQVKKTSRGSEAYFDLISRNIIVSRDPFRASIIAIEKLAAIQLEREAAQESL